jgi:histone H3/H4
MSDYSFMKSGLCNTSNKQSFTENELENIEVMLGLFTTNAIKNAARYVRYSGRNGITEIDINYALKYEVFEFLKRPNILEEFKKYKEDVSDDEMDDGLDDGLDDEMDDELDDDTQIDEFSRINDDKIGNENKEFIEKVHNYFDTWDDWIPSTPLEVILKNAIDKIN